MFDDGKHHGIWGLGSRVIGSVRRYSMNTYRVRGRGIINEDVKMQCAYNKLGVQTSAVSLRALLFFSNLRKRAGLQINIVSR
jgi:hypothetical protein